MLALDKRLLVRCWDSPHLGIGVVCEVVAQGELQWGDCLCSITCMAFLELLPYYACCRDVGCAAEDGDDFVGCNITFSHEAFGVRVRVPALNWDCFRAGRDWYAVPAPTRTLADVPQALSSSVSGPTEGPSR